MIASVASTTSVTNFPGAGLQVGELAARGRDEGLFLGQRVGRSSSSLGDAMSAAAGLTAGRDGSAMAVVRDNGAYQAYELLQPVWTRTGLFREEAFGGERSRIEPMGRGDQVAFSEFRTGEYGREDKQKYGSLQLDAASGVEAIVGTNWGFRNGSFERVTASYPQPAPAPAPAPRPTPAPAPRPNPAPAPNPGPVNPPARSVVEDVTEGLRLAQEAARIIGTVPPSDRGEESSKEARVKAFKTNMAAQARLERQFDAGNEAGVLSTLRSADASLEDANWQLAKKPSPDGRFNGVDVPGALRDTQRAVDLLGTLLEELKAAA